MSQKNKENKEPEVKSKEGFIDKIREFYRKKYKPLLIVPFALLFIAIIIIGFQYFTTGDFISKGITLKGGITITIPHEKDINKDLLKEYLVEQFPGYEINIRTLSSSGVETGIIIESDITSSEEANRFIEALENKLDTTKEKFTIEEIGSALGQSFFRETSLLLLLAFVFMAIVIFIVFRKPVISGAVVLSALSDIIVTIAILDLIGFKIGTAGIAALLMLISYSVDTDVLLSTRVLRRKQSTIFEAVMSSVKTGMTMTLTTLLAVTAALIFTNSPVLREIMLIVFIGLIVDIINTYIQNVGLIRWYLKDD